MAKKVSIVKVRLISSGKNSNGNSTGFTYYIKKEPQKHYRENELPQV
jgi:hypothetical protein